MIRLDIISGFLGAGKTTLIKKLLHHCSAQGEKVVLIENEFGEEGIDGDLIKEEGFEVYEMSQGCICCSLRTDFESALHQIIHDIKPDRIIFEPSGIFVLSEVLDLLKKPEVYSKCIVNTIATVVDSAYYLKQISNFGYFFRDQIAHADVLLLSKTQLASSSRIQDIINSLRDINSYARIMTKDWKHLTAEDIQQLLVKEIRYDLDALLHTNRSCCCLSGHNHHDHHSHHDHGCGFSCTKHQNCSDSRHHHCTDDEYRSSHNHGFDTLGIKASRVFTAEELEDFLKQMGDMAFGDVLRGKGFIKSIKGVLEFSYVNGDYSIQESSMDSSARACFIGRNLDKTKLRELLTGISS